MIGIHLASQVSPPLTTFAHPDTPAGKLCMSSQSPGVTNENSGSVPLATSCSSAPEVAVPSGSSSFGQSPAVGAPTGRDE